MIDTAVILAAGRGSRLKEITEHRSKALAPIAGLPIIGRVMESLREAGVSRFVVVAAPHDQELRAHYADNPAVTVLTQPEPRGSADALKVCAAHVPQNFVVCACDSLVPSAHIRELLATHHSGDAHATLSVMEVSPDESLTSRSVVRIEDGRVLDIIEKPKPEERFSNITSLPLYALSKEIFREIDELPVSARGEYELPGAFREMIRKERRVLGVIARERLDLTNIRDLLALNLLFLDKLSPPVQVHPAARVSATATVVGPVLIEEGCEVADGARIGPRVYLERGAKVTTGVGIRDVVVTRGSTVDSSQSGLVVV